MRSDPVVPYLDMMRKLLETTLMPEEEAPRKAAVYGHRMLTMLAIRLQKLPLIQQRALLRIEALLDDLVAELQKMDGTMILVPQLVCHVRTSPDYRQAEPYLQNAVRLLAANPDEKRKQLQLHLLEITLALQEEIHQAAMAGSVQPAKGMSKPKVFDGQKKLALQSYLRKRFPSEVDIEVVNIRLVVGGGSKQTLIVDLQGTQQLPASIVLRLDSTGGVVASKVINEYQLIKTMFDAGMLVPQPLSIESDVSILGAPFIVVSRIEGHNIGDWEEVSEPSRTFAVDLAHTLAKLHNIAPHLAGEGLPGAKASIRNRIGSEMAAFEASWRTFGEPSIAMEQAYAWLKAHLDFSDGKRSIIHCDVGCHNMLGHNGRLTALLDWETAVIGNPAQDLAYVRHTVEQMMPWSQFLVAYGEAGGSIPSAGELDFYRLWRGIFTMHYEYMARSFFLSGMSSELIIAYSSQHVFQNCYYELHKTLQHVYQRYP